MRGSRGAFWATVAGVSILANFGLELLALKVPALGLQQFVAFCHLGGGGDLQQRSNELRAVS